MNPARLLIPLLFFSLLANSSLSLANAGRGKKGGWSGGGGTGIACFTTKEMAEKAKSARAQSLPLSKQLLDSITQLYATEVWEWSLQSFVVPENGETSDAYLDRILKSLLESVSPSFYLKLKQALDRTRFDNTNIANYQSQVESTEDTGPVRRMGANGLNASETCTLVQIATRYARTQADGKIEAVIEINKGLYEKLGFSTEAIWPEGSQIVNQAALKLHEALYLLGYGLNHQTSESVRSMVATLLHRDFLMQDHLLKHKHLRFISRDKIIHILFQNGFGDFPFLETENISSQKALLRQAYAKYENRLIDLIKSKTAANLNLSFYNSLSALPEDEAFIYISQSSAADEKIVDFFSLIDPEYDSTNDIKAICEMADKLANGKTVTVLGPTITKSLGEKALRFCSQL
jgi:hypothetical protein